nr:FUSC family protein [uncultured Methanoregula sp.]
MSGSAGDTEGPGGVAGFLRRMASPLSTALQFAVVSSLSFSLALFLSYILPDYADTRMIGAMWAMISAIIVTQDTRSQTISTAWFRVQGSLIGAIFSAIYLTFFPFSIAGLGILIGIVVLTCELLKMPTHLRLAALTAGIVMVVSAQNPDIPPFANAAHRFLEVIIGSTVAVVAALVWQYVSRRS